MVRPVASPLRDRRRHRCRAGVTITGYFTRRSERARCPIMLRQRRTSIASITIAITSWSSTMPAGAATTGSRNLTGCSGERRQARLGGFYSAAESTLRRWSPLSGENSRARTLLPSTPPIRQRPTMQAAVERIAAYVISSRHRLMFGCASFQELIRRARVAALLPLLLPMAPPRCGRVL